MAEITQRFTYAGRNCYTFRYEDGIEMPYTERGLYDPDNIRLLKESGYRFLNYHGDIVSPEGINIKDMVEDACSYNETELQNMLDLESSALPEEKATQHFDRDLDIPEIEMRKPKVKIRTREELVKYLDSYIQSARLGINEEDVLPLNSFVATEALFTLQEIQTDCDAQRYMSIIENRRRIKSYDAFKKLVQFLRTEGLLRENFTVDELKAAYSAWGVCGIKAKVVEMTTELGVKSSIFSTSSKKILDAQSLEGSVIETCLLGKDGTIYYSTGQDNIINEEDFTLLPMRPAREKEYVNYVSSSRRWPSEYRALQCVVPRLHNRTYMTLMGEDGITYRVKIDHDNMVISSNRGIILTQGYLKIRMFDKTYTSVEKVLTENNYKIWSLCVAKAYDLAKKNTKEPPVSSSYELLRQEGLSPASAIKYAARRINECPELNSHLKTGIDYWDAVDKYMIGPNEDLIKKYNPDELQYEGIDELIDIMCNTRDEMEAAGEYLSAVKDGGISSESREIIERPVDKLEFVKNFKQGVVSIDNLGMGYMVDGQVDYVTIATFLATYIRVTVGENPDETTVKQVLEDIDRSKELIDVTEVIAYRGNAHRGAIQDRAELNNIRATECSAAVYVTKVYREAANLPAEEQRPYAFECVYLNMVGRKSGKNKAANVQMGIAESVKEAVKRERIPQAYIREVLEKESTSIALDIMFRVAFDNIKVEFGEGRRFVKYTCRICDDIEPIDITVDIGDDEFEFISNKANFDTHAVCTLDNWCVSEVSVSRFKLYCLNANITPWSVEPKRGVKIMTYNFAVNYNRCATFKYFSDEFNAKVNALNAKVDELSRFSSEDYALLSNEDGPNVAGRRPAEFTPENVDFLLLPDAAESIEDYYKRFSVCNKAAAARGQYLKRMPLRSDVLFDNFAAPEDNVCESYEYATRVGSEGNLWLTACEPISLAEIVYEDRLEANVNDVQRFILTEEYFEDSVRWTDLIYNTFKPAAVMIVFGTKMLCVTQKGKLERDLKYISMEDCEKLAAKGIFYQIGARKFLIRTSAGDYSVEVR